MKELSTSRRLNGQVPETTERRKQLSDSDSSGSPRTGKDGKTRKPPVRKPRPAPEPVVENAKKPQSPAEWVTHSWPNARAYLDETMKLVAILPGAVNAKDDDDGDHFADALGELSTQLYCLDMWLGENPPGYVPPRPPNHPSAQATDGKPNWDEISRAQTERAKLMPPGMHLYPGQVELITRLFHEATDAGCELLTVLTDDDESERAHRSEGYLESLAKRVVQAMWSIRWEMNIDSPQVDDDESEAP